MSLITPVEPTSQCTAHSKRTGERCRHPAMHGKTVCYHHGGKSLEGLASRTFIHGRYSKVLPVRLAADYKRAERDPDLLALRSEIALADARLAELLRRLDTGEAGAIWAALQKTWAALQEARRAADTAKMAGLMATLGQLIDQGAADSATWAEVTDLLYLRRRLVETEHKRLVALEQLLTAEQAMVLVSAVVDAVRRHVTDRPTLAAISEDITRLVSSADGRTAGPVEG